MAWALLPSGALLYVALYAVVPMLPGLERLFGTPPGSAHLGISLPFVLLVLLSPLVPRLRLPAGMVMGGGLLGVGLFGVLAGLAPSLEIWTLCRTLQGAFAAAVPGLSLALLPRLYPRKHAQMAGFWVAGNVLGGGLGRGLGGLFAEWFGERWAMVLLALPVAVIAWAVLRTRDRLALPAPQYTLRAWPLYTLGFILLFLNFFVTNLLPYRLEALGLSQAQIGGIFFAYLAGIPGSALAGALVRRLGEVRAFRLAFGLVTLGLLAQLPDQPLWILVGFVAMMAGIFTAQAIAGGASGRGGSGVSGTYVAAFYLGGTVAGLVYPPFIGQSPLWGLEVALGVSLLAVLLAGRALR
ncbi:MULTISPECIES: MFS transporter [Meiothermus]|uniref:Major facilitator superfamily MFS_1 n=3 Tax=Meiothermus TaxID=65551 RepID=D3PQB4_MEIRD|nr:MFS transporter [Meiothermus ruber]ADD29747.1 major facilitator superfamily MFS_1 [Meiothermus ruber DSM 1279]AGK04797.1 major facilitator superfamily protein [Meiothermus ruber DSM 1279]MCL6529552.1 MFS transporter [Meiothermus ruber]MCX7802774.1 MFS transporter [Meiothermus ruber]GAO76668.1 major facilitator superfamily protein [Meiothermus ruber H328]